MSRFNNGPPMGGGGNGPPASTSGGRGAHLLKPAWMTQQQQPTMNPDQPSGLSQRPAPTATTTTSYPPASYPVQQQQQQQQPYGMNRPPGQQQSSYPPPSSQQYQARPSMMPQMQQQSQIRPAGFPPSSVGSVMPSIGGTMPPPLWVESKTPEGRTFYSNTVTGQASFEKPWELKTIAERQLPTSPWREYCRDGKSYYFNSETKESLWEEPLAFTTHKSRLRSYCAGEAPTKDQISLATYQAAKKALEELVVDLDGSLARKRASEESAAKAAEAAIVETVKKPDTSLVEISGDLVRTPSSVSWYSQISPSPKSLDEAKDVFAQMLDDWSVPAQATWEEAFSYGIAADPRYSVLPSLQSRKLFVSDRRSRALASGTLNKPEDDRLAQKQKFEAFLDELEADKILGSRSSFQALLPVLKYKRQLHPPSETDARAWLDARVDLIRSRVTVERDAKDLAQESTVHDAIQKLLGSAAEALQKDEIAAKLMESGLSSTIPADQIRKYCGTFAQSVAKRKEAQIKEAEQKKKQVLESGLLRAFSEGLLSIDCRWAEFRNDDDLRARRAPWIVELILPFAGNEGAVEEIFRNARDKARDYVTDAGRIIRESAWNLSNVKSALDLNDPLVLDDLRNLQAKYGVGIVDRAVTDQARRYAKDKDRFFELLAKYVRSVEDANWEKIQPIISERTAYRDMASDQARKAAFDEFVSSLDVNVRKRSTSRSRDRSRSPHGGRTKRRG